MLVVVLYLHIVCIVYAVQLLLGSEVELSCFIVCVVLVCDEWKRKCSVLKVLCIEHRLKST